MPVYDECRTIWVGEKGTQRRVISYRSPQRTGLWLEGDDNALVIPLPGLMMIRDTNGNRPYYKIFAVKEAPTDEDCVLYCAPMPHVGYSGVCWGTVHLPSKDALKSSDLSADWRQFLGSRFGAHGIKGQSQTHKDIRQLWRKIDKRQHYPLADLVETDYCLGDFLMVGRS